MDIQGNCSSCIYVAIEEDYLETKRNHGLAQKLLSPEFTYVKFYHIGEPAEHIGNSLGIYHAGDKNGEGRRRRR